MTHRHTFQGQSLVHDHEGGDRPHGYFGHREDGGPLPPGPATGTYERMTDQNLLDRVTGFMDEQLSRDDMSLEEIAGQVITMVIEDGAPTDEQAAVRDAIMAWQDGSEGARDRLNTIFASWAANSLPIHMQNRQEIADSIAMTITAGIAPYLEAAVLRLAAKVRETGELARLQALVAARPDAQAALEFVLEQPVGGPSCGCGLKHWDCDEDVSAYGADEGE